MIDFGTCKCKIFAILIKIFRALCGFCCAQFGCFNVCRNLAEWTRFLDFLRHKLKKNIQQYTAKYNKLLNQFIWRRKESRVKMVLNNEPICAFQSYFSKCKVISTLHVHLINLLYMMFWQFNCQKISILRPRRIIPNGPWATLILGFVLETLTVKFFSFVSSKRYEESFAFFSMGNCVVAVEQCVSKTRKFGQIIMNQ